MNDQDTDFTLTPIERIIRPFQEFLKLQASSGILLMICALVALGWANSPWSGSYHSIWDTKLSLAYGEQALLAKPLLLWVNDGLMAVFFLLVGLEIKRELVSGELSTLRQAVLPAAAALGGMLVPAGIFALFNKGTETTHGWGIPMATDIAFSLGILALLGRRAPLALKVFLTAIAIVDDLGAVVVIAVFYTAKIHWLLLAASLGVWLLAVLFGRLGGRHPVVFILLGFFVWIFMLKSGVHATIAGVLMALAIPGKQLSHESDPATEIWEHTLHPWVAFIIMPLFAFANAGVGIDAGMAKTLLSPGALGIILGLVLGKPLGILLFSWMAVRADAAELPRGMTWVNVLGVGLLAGIGFTMSLFVAELAYSGAATHLATAKIAVLIATMLAGLSGYVFLRATASRNS